MKEILDKQIENDNLLPPTIKTIDIRDYFNKRLINTDIREDFNEMYERYFKCLICNDVVFNPIYCSECENIFCKTCISINKHKNNLLLCDHTKISTELPKLKKELFEKIKINCFFKCNNKSLDLLSYPSHLKSCKEKYESKFIKTNETNEIVSKIIPNANNANNTSNKNLTNITTIDKIQLKHLESGSFAKLQASNAKLVALLKNKENIIKSLQIQLIEEKRESLGLKISLEKKNKLFIELEAKIQNSENDFIILNSELQNKVKMINRLKQKIDKYLNDIAVLDQNLYKQTHHNEMLEKNVKQLFEEKNELLMFNSSSQILSSEEIAFRKLIKENSNPELTSLNLNGKNLTNSQMKYLPECSFLKNLTSLDLRNNPLLDQEGYIFLKDCVFIDNLTDLKMVLNIKGSNLIGRLNFQDPSKFDFKNNIHSNTMVDFLEHLNDFKFLNDKLKDLDLSKEEVNSMSEHLKKKKSKKTFKN